MPLLLLRLALGLRSFSSDCSIVVDNALGAYIALPSDPVRFGHLRRGSFTGKSLRFVLTQEGSSLLSLTLIASGKPAGLGFSLLL